MTGRTKADVAVAKERDKLKVTYPSVYIHPHALLRY